MCGFSDDEDVHVILNNYCAHKENDEWLQNGRRVKFHFTPTSVGWLNQIGIWRGILFRKTFEKVTFAGI